MLLLAGVAVAVPIAQRAPDTPRLSDESSRFGPVFRSGVELVTLSVTVERPDGTPRLGLAEDDFRLYEEGIPQDIVFFGTERVPVDLVLMLDSSASMRGRMGTVKEAARNFIHALRPIDRAAVMTIASRVHVLDSFISDAAQLEEAIDSAKAGGTTAFYDALYVALKQFGSVPSRSEEVRRRAVVVLSDGSDTASLLSFDDILELARRSNVAIYPISIVPESQRATNDPRVSDDDFELRMLARETGARSFFPKAITDLDGVYASIAEELANQYSIGYTPQLKTARHGFRRVAVVVDAPNVIVRTRRGYIAGG